MGSNAVDHDPFRSPEMEPETVASPGLRVVLHDQGAQLWAIW